MFLKLELIKQYTIKLVEELSMTMYLTMASATHLLAEMWYMHFLYVMSCSHVCDMLGPRLKG